MNNIILNAFADELEKVAQGIAERAPAAGAVIGGTGGAVLGAKGGAKALARKGVIGAGVGTLLGLMARAKARKREELRS